MGRRRQRKIIIIIIIIKKKCEYLDHYSVADSYPKINTARKPKIKATVGGVPPIFTPAGQSQKRVYLLDQGYGWGGTPNFHARGSKPKEGIPLRSRLR